MKNLIILFYLFSLATFAQWVPISEVESKSWKGTYRKESCPGKCIKVPLGSSPDYLEVDRGLLGLGSPEVKVNQSEKDTFKANLRKKKEELEEIVLTEKSLRKGKTLYARVKTFLKKKNLNPSQRQSISSGLQLLRNQFFDGEICEGLSSFSSLPLRQLGATKKELQRIENKIKDAGDCN